MRGRLGVSLPCFQWRKVGGKKQPLVWGEDGIAFVAGRCSEGIAVVPCQGLQLTHFVASYAGTR